MQRSIGGVRVSRVGVSREETTNGKLSEAEIFNMNGVLNRLISSVKISKVEVQVQDVPAARTFESKERHTLVNPEDLSEQWSIGLGQAKETLKRTTQRIVRLAVMPLARRYRADRIFEKRRLRGEWFTDTLDGRVASKDGIGTVKCLPIVDTLPRFTRWILRARQATLCKRFVKSLARLTG